MFGNVDDKIDIFNLNNEEYMEQLVPTVTEQETASDGDVPIHQVSRKSLQALSLQLHLKNIMLKGINFFQVYKLISLI